MKIDHKLLPSLLLVIAGCAGAGPEVVDQPAQSRLQMAELGAVHLEAEAQEAVGLKAQIVTRQTMAAKLPATGWLMTAPGRESIVKAGTTGFFLPASEKSSLEVGSAVSRGHQLGAIQVFLSPQEEAQLVAAKEEADILMNQALVSKQLAENQLKSLEANEITSAVGAARLIGLKEIIQRNQVAYEEGRDKLPFLPKEPYASKLALREVTIESPISGSLLTLHAAPRQLVVQGDPLWTISDWSVLWVRVPVFEGDLPRIQRDQAATVRPLGIQSFQAEPVSAPQPTETGRRTVDVLFRLDNPKTLLRPGQAVPISLPLGESQEQLAVPRSAIIWDGLGNAWVYVKSTANTFRRQKVELGTGDEVMVAIDRGLEDGQVIVTVGAQALYGEEFKSQLPAGGDD